MIPGIVSIILGSILLFLKFRRKKNFFNTSTNSKFIDFYTDFKLWVGIVVLILGGLILIYNNL